MPDIEEPSYKEYTIKKDGIEINIKVVKEFNLDNNDDDDFKKYLNSLSETNLKDLKNGAQVFKIIIEDSENANLIRDMYYDKRLEWLAAADKKKYIECFTLSAHPAETADNCMNTPKFFYDFLVVKKEDIIKPAAAPAAAPAASPAAAPAASPAAAPASVEGGTRRRRRNNKKSKRKSKNNRKKTNRRR
jgi:hypothetical protein